MMESVPKNMDPMIDKRQEAPRYNLLTRVDILVGGGGDTYWGSLVSLNRTGVTLRIRQPLKPGQEVTIRFLFQSEDGRTGNESLTGMVAWLSGDTSRVEFKTPLTVGAQALKGVPLLAASLAIKEWGGQT